MSNLQVVNDKEAKILVELLSTPSGERDLKKLQKIKECLVNVKFLQSYSDTKDYDNVIQNLELERHVLDHVLFKQEDAASKFYIILTGVIGLFVNVQSENKDRVLGQGVKEIAKLEPGEGFGELGLLFNEGRTTTAICLEQTILLSLNKQIFDKYLSNAKNEKLDTLTNFYKNLWIFRTLTSKEILKISTKTTLSKCNSNNIIIRQGEQPKGVFFIYNGMVKIIQTLKFKIDPDSGEILDDVRDPTHEQIKARQFKTIDMEIEEIGNGSYFCDYYIFNQLDVPFTAITITQCDILTITDFDLKNCLDKQIYQDFRDQSKIFPPSDKIKKQFFENLMWKNYKSKLMLNLNHEIINNRRCKSLRKGGFLQKIDLKNFQIYEEEDFESDKLSPSLRESPLKQKKLKQRTITEKIIIKKHNEHMHSEFLLNNVDEKQKMIDNMKHKKARSQSNKFILPKINPRSNVFNLINQIY